MTEKDLEIQELRRRLKNSEADLKSAMSDLVYVLNNHSLCEICKYAKSNCWPETGNCVPKWRGLR